MAIAATAPYQPPSPAEPAASVAPANADSRFSFHDFLSILNPLQHIPVVGTLYRAFTGDKIKPFERILGDTLYGGWMGCASSVANFVFEKETGKDFGDTILGFVENAVGMTSGLSEIASGATESRPASTDSAGANESSRATAFPAVPTTIDPHIGLRAQLAYQRALGGTPAQLDLAAAL